MSDAQQYSTAALCAITGRLTAKLSYENTFEYGFILEVTPCRGKNKIKYR